MDGIKELLFGENYNWIRLPSFREGIDPHIQRIYEERQKMVYPYPLETIEPRNYMEKDLKKLNELKKLIKMSREDPIYIPDDKDLIWESFTDDDIKEVTRLWMSDFPFEIKFKYYYDFIEEKKKKLGLTGGMFDSKERMRDEARRLLMLGADRRKRKGGDLFNTTPFPFYEGRGFMDPTYHNPRDINFEKY